MLNYTMYVKVTNVYFLIKYSYDVEKMKPLNFLWKITVTNTKNCKSRFTLQVRTHCTRLRAFRCNRVYKTLTCVQTLPPKPDSSEHTPAGGLSAGKAV